MSNHQQNNEQTLTHSLKLALLESTPTHAVSYRTSLNTGEPILLIQQYAHKYISGYIHKEELLFTVK